MQAPEQRPAIKQEDDEDEDAADELHLGMHAPGTQVVRDRSIEISESKGLEDVDGADGEPAQQQDKQGFHHLLDFSANLLRNLWNCGEDDKKADGKKDCARWQGDISPEAQITSFGGCLFLAKQPEDQEVDTVAENHHSGNQKDGVKPVIAG